MLQDLFDSPVWLQALSLEERVQLWPPGGIQGGKRPSSSSHGTVDSDPRLAQRRFERWREQFSSPGQEILPIRLAALGLDEAGFLKLLGESAESLHRRAGERPDWLVALETAFTQHGDSPTLPGPDPAKEPARYGFLLVALPIYRQAYGRLRDGMDELEDRYGSLPFDRRKLGGQLMTLLSGRMLTLLGRVMVLELNIAEAEGKLAGESSQDRFASFLRRISDPQAALAILADYPVLARLLVECSDLWAEFCLDFLGHFTADRQELCRGLLADADPGALVEVSGHLSDPHRGGRSVLILRFADGRRLVYKPKPLAVEAGFQQLLRWVGEKGFEPALRSLGILDRGEYGWVEFVETGGCESEDEIRRFYLRQGGYQALLHVLQATDFHHENLLAAGEHPVMVDLEALFHPTLDSVFPSYSPEGDSPSPLSAGELAADPYQSSVLRVGMLPQRMWTDEDGDGVDLSGLGGERGQLTPSPVLQTRDEGSSNMRIVRERAPMKDTEHRPRLHGEDVFLADYVEEIATGFATMYRLLLAHREELLAESGPLAVFAAAEIRVIVRATRGYSLLQLESAHPFVLRNALDRARLFDRLWTSLEQRPYLERMVPLELRELERADVPMFTSRPTSRDAWSGLGEHLPDVLTETGLARVERLIGELDEDDLKRQVRIIRGTFRSLELTRALPPWPAVPLTAAAPVPPERFVEAARAVGDHLAEQAYRSESHAMWLGLLPAGDGPWWTYEVAGLDLYGGHQGIALFFAQLGAATGEERYHELGRAAVAPVRSYLERSASFLPSIGAMSGWGGWILTQIHLAALWDDPAYDATAEAGVEELAARIADDTNYDVLSGAAGGILGLLRLYRRRGFPRAREVAVRCGEHLLAHAETLPTGLGWTLQHAGPKPLLGMSHGAAGIAWALFELAAESGEARFRDAARGALAYERSFFDTSEANWPDLRQKESVGAGTRFHGDHDEFMCAWCHGATGIGLARLAALPYVDDPAERRQMRREIDVAVATTLGTSLGTNDSLCHGDLGNLDFLLEVSRSFGDGALRSRVEELAAGVLARIEQRGWLPGLPLGADPPGLMLGMAGIGHGLLRMARPNEIPQLLTLASPDGTRYGLEAHERLAAFDGELEAVA